MGLQKFDNEDAYKTAKNCTDGKALFVQYSADWCGPCQAIEGNMDEFATKYADKCHFRYFDVEAFEDLAQEEEIENMPTFKIFR